MSLLSFLCTRVRLKVLSLLFATVIWFFVMLETGDELEFAVPLQPVNVSPAFSVVMNPPQLKVRLGGARALLLRQQLIGLNAEIDLRQRGAGVVTLESIESYLHVIPGLKVLAVTPESPEIVISHKK